MNAKQVFCICRLILFFDRWGLEKKKGDSINKEKDKKEEEEINEKIILVAFPEKKKEVHKVPSTRLSISEDASYIAIGASDGSVALVKSDTLQSVSNSILSKQYVHFPQRFLSLD